MILVWYNPDLDRYEKGARLDYSVQSNSSINHDRFELIHEFENSDKSNRLAEKITNSLNIVRIQDPSHREIFV